MQATEAYIIRLLWSTIVGSVNSNISASLHASIEGSWTIFWPYMLTLLCNAGMKWLEITVQLSSKEAFAYIPDTSCTCSVHVSRQAKRAWQLRKPCCSFIVRFCACINSSCMCPRCVSLALDTCKRYYTLEMSCTVLTLETVPTVSGMVSRARHGWPREYFVRRFWWNFLYAYQEVGNTEHLHSVGVKVEVYKSQKYFSKY